MFSKSGILLIFLWCCLGVLPLYANEEDRILSFHSDINIQTNGVCEVKETIKVYNGSSSYDNPIQRGIVRSFPTNYKTKEGLRSNVPFKVKAILKNGITEPYHTKKLSNGIELYMGSSDVYLPDGIYTYEITYETGKQIIFHKDKDEFYWNVNGNGWKFNAEEVSCTVHFPDAASIKEEQCYTGTMGSTAQECSSKRTAANSIYFKSNQALNPYEGLTVAVAIEKGVLMEPSETQKFISMLQDNWILPLLIVFLFFIFGINLRHWLKYGKDPKQGIIYPQFSPPEGMSPADVGYLTKQRFTSELFAASIVDYAVHNKVDIAIKQEGLVFKSQVYSFAKPAKPKPVQEKEPNRKEWYGYTIESLYGKELKKGTYNATLALCYAALEGQLKKRLLIKKNTKNSFNGLFRLNEGFIVLVSILVVIMIIGTVVYLVNFPNPMLIFASIILLLSAVIIHVFFSKIMSAYTVEGRKIADHVLGFKMYLETTEQRIYDAMNPPDMTIQLFEKFLPYAIALNCESKWSQKFEDVISKAMQEGYQPSYYSNSSGMNFSSAAFASSLSSGLSSTISSASTPPSSSGGGSGGGGSSGGGGGGGGGGGW